MSRAKVIALVILAVFPVVLTALVLPFLPDVVAFHFGATGIDRWEDKVMLFLPSGIVTVLSLFVVWIAWASNHPAGPNGEPLLLADRGPMSFGMCAGTLGILNVTIAAPLGYNLMLPNLEAPTSATGSLVAGLGIVAAMILLWGMAAVFLSGKGMRYLNGHPGVSKREEDRGDGVAQSRAIGFLLLFLSFVTLAMVLAPTILQKG